MEELTLSHEDYATTIRLAGALQNFYEIQQIKDSISPEHINKTPHRIVDAMLEMFEGCWQDPKTVLNTLFSNNKLIGVGPLYDEIIYVNDIIFVSMCAHHNLPFVGKMHFGYLPHKHYVGLSKIPRLVETFSKRPQVQEKLTGDIVDSFMSIVEPHGCGLTVEAYHLCVSIRGVENESAYTKTSALRGIFKTQDSTRQEYLNGIRKTTEKIWP